MNSFAPPSFIIVDNSLLSSAYITGLTTCLLFVPGVLMKDATHRLKINIDYQLKYFVRCHNCKKEVYDVLPTKFCVNKGEW